MAGVPALSGALGSGGNYDAAGAASVRSGGSARSRVPLSARSAASAISMHVNSYSYLSNRVYDYMHAKSEWLRRTPNEHAGGGDEWEDAALQVRNSLHRQYKHERTAFTPISKSREACYTLFLSYNICTVVRRQPISLVFVRGVIAAY